MSHFVGLVIVPENEVQTNEDYDKTKEMAQYDSAFHSEHAEEILMPYSEHTGGYKFDWYAEGGRWRGYGKNGIFKNLDDILATEKVYAWQTLGWFKLDHKDVDLLKENTKDSPLVKNLVVKKYELIKGGADDGMVKRDSDGKRIVKEYYTPEELYERVIVPKVSFHSVITKEDGWIEESEMGWFGVTVGDTKEAKEQKELADNWNKQVKEVVSKYHARNKRNKKTKYIGLTYDFHI